MDHLEGDGTIKELIAELVVIYEQEGRFLQEDAWTWAWALPTADRSSGNRPRR
ncbi:DUF7557 family protein [Natrinema limicola]